MRKILNEKGMSLIEMFIVLAIIGIATPLIMIFFVVNMRGYAGTNHYIEQQYDLQNAIRYIREDVEAAKDVFIYKDPSDSTKVTGVGFIKPGSTEQRVWSFESDSLYLKIYNDGDETHAPDSQSEMIENIDINASKFDYREELAGANNYKHLMLYIKMKRDENKERNFQDVIRTEFSVRYKSVTIK